MCRISQLLVAGAISLVVLGCGESSTTTSSVVSADLTNALATAPPGFSATLSTFDGTADTGPTTWAPHRNESAFTVPWSATGFMGGGLSHEFLGEDSFQFGVSARPFDNDPDHDGDDAQCTFSTASGTLTCSPVTRHGLTVTETITFTDTSGHAQPARNGATNTIETKIAAGGTITRDGHDDAQHADTTVVQFASDRTVGGLATASTSHAVSATSSGVETTTGISDSLHFTTIRTIGDTTTGLVIPIQDHHPTFPTAGTVVRSMTVKMTMGNGTPTTASRREVITYDGTSTAKVVITKNGTIQNCTLPLPHGKLTCA